LATNKSHLHALVTGIAINAIIGRNISDCSAAHNGLIAIQAEANVIFTLSHILPSTQTAHTFASS